MHKQLQFDRWDVLLSIYKYCKYAVMSFHEMNNFVISYPVEFIII